MILILTSPYLCFYITWGNKEIVYLTHYLFIGFMFQKLISQCENILGLMTLNFLLTNITISGLSKNDNFAPNRLLQWRI